MILFLAYHHLKINMSGMLLNASEESPLLKNYNQMQTLEDALSQVPETS
jgi:hypothetical protein